MQQFVSASNVAVPKEHRSVPIDGLLLLLVSANPKGEPRLEMREPREQTSPDKNTRQTSQLFGIDVDWLVPGTAAIVDVGAIGFPVETLSRVPAGEYSVQAVLNVYETFHRKDGHVVKLPGSVGRSGLADQARNLYSEPRRIRIFPASGGTIAISLDKEIPPLPLPKSTKYLKYVRIETSSFRNSGGARQSWRPGCCSRRGSTSTQPLITRW